MKPSKTFMKSYLIFPVLLVILIGMTAIVVSLDHQEGQSEEKVIPILTGTNDPLPEHIAPGIEKTATRLAEIDSTLTATALIATPLFTSSVNQ